MTAPTPSPSPMEAQRPMQGLADWLRCEEARHRASLCARDPAVLAHVNTLSQWAAEVETAQQGHGASGERVPCSRCTSDVYCEMNGCQRPAAAPVQASVAPSDDALTALSNLSDEEVLTRAPVLGNISALERDGFCAGFRRCAACLAATAPLPPPSLDKPPEFYQAQADAEAPPSAPQPFGWLFEGPQGVRQFSKGSDCIKPVLDLHRRMAQEKPEYTLTALYTRPASAPVGVRVAMEKAVYELEHQQPSGYVTRAVEALNAALASRTEAAPAAQRMPLSDEKILRVFFDVYGEDNTTHAVPWKFARAIEAAHGIQEAKNAVGGRADFKTDDEKGSGDA